MNANQICTPVAGAPRNSLSQSAISSSPQTLNAPDARAAKPRPRLSARSLALFTAAGVALVATSLAGPVMAQVVAPAAGSNWTTPAGTVEGTRFSSLNQVNTTNVSRLRQEFAAPAQDIFQVGVVR